MHENEDTLLATAHRSTNKRLEHFVLVKSVQDMRNVNSDSFCHAASVQWPRQVHCDPAKRLFRNDFDGSPINLNISA